MRFGIEGRIAVVCGASRGIGYAVAEQLVQEGARVVMVSRDVNAVGRAAARLAEAHGVEVHAVAADLAVADGPSRVIEEVHARYGGADLLITNTGGPKTGSALGHDWDAWQGATELLLRSAVQLARGFVPGMQQRGWGRVVGITSIAVKQPVASLVLSNALRAGVTGFFRTLADEVAKDGVTVNTVLPGYTATERLEELAQATSSRTGAEVAAVYDGWRAVTPAGRLGKPEEVAAMITFLCSEPAAFITGQAMCVDGGAGRSLL